jgi:hypothetical protein
MILLSCNQNCKTGLVGKRLDFYFLQDYKTKTQSDAIIPESVVLSNEKAISYEEILNYNPENHGFTLKRSTIERLNTEPSIHKRTFAVVIDGEIIYTGYFWALFSSSICDWTNIDYLDNGSNIIYVKLGYPNDAYGINTIDERNNKRILDLLDCDGKLTD